MMDMNVGVYQIGKTDSEKAVTDPIKVIDTGSRGLSAVVMGKEKIYMGFFMGNDESANLQVHVYSSPTLAQVASSWHGLSAQESTKHSSPSP